MTRSDAGEKQLQKASLSRRAFVACAVALAGGALSSAAGCAPTGADTPSDPEPDEDPNVSDVPESLPDWVDPQVAQTLLSQAGDPAVDSILRNAERMAEAADPAVAAKLLKLAATDRSARRFVAGFADSYPGTEAGALTEADLAVGDIPLFLQWDPRWGYMEYLGGPMGTTGCCPTCLSMVYAGLTRRCDLNPYDVSRLVLQSGLCSPETGTHGEFVETFAQHVGLEYVEVVDIGTAEAGLRAGYVLVCNLGPGSFTEVGHYVLAVGLTAEGAVEVRDPYTSYVSSHTWPLASLFYESNSVYALRLPQVLG